MRGRSRPTPTCTPLLLAAIALFSLSCESDPHSYGYWEGKGTAMEIPMNDGVRKLTRSAEFEFWFTLAESGDAVGEIDLEYNAELTVDNLPNVTVPAPGGSSVSFNPEVGGTMTDPDPTRRFPLVGVLEGEELTLAIATAEGDRAPLEFTIRADAGVSGGMPIGGASVDGLSPGDTQVIVQEIEMTPFSPFNASVAVKKRPGGPFAVHFEDKGDNFGIEWSARQMGGEQRDLELTPELELELRRLRESLGS